MIRRSKALWAVLCAFVLATCSTPEPERPEHVLLVVIDTLRADHLSIFGYPRPTSPTIDALAREGVLFKRALSQASFTSPSMVSLMTGRYIAKERATIPADLTTLAENFQRAGWATGGFASNPLITAENGFARGFDTFAALAEHGPNEEIERFLSANKGRRTFTYVHITEPHDPYVSPEGQRQWRESAGYLPGDRAEFYARVAAELGLKSSPELVSRIQQEIGGYDDEVRYADGRVGAVLAHYAELGLRERLSVALTADHGEGLWQHVALMNGQRGKSVRAGETPDLMNTLMPTHGNQVHQSLVHVPLVLSGVGLPRGKPIDAPVENVDLYPTLLELAGLKLQSGLQGRSLLRWLESEPPREAHAFSFTRFNVTVVDREGWALILPTAEGECAEQLQLELFYLPEDPHQRRNRAGDKPQIVERLRKVAEQRLSIGIAEADAQPPSDENRAALEQLGYLDQLAQADLRREYERAGTEELLAKFANSATPCTQRLLAAEMLGKRALDEASKSALREHLARETSNAVKTQLERALAR
jgi:arylsulfatase A-like enzyme